MQSILLILALSVTVGAQNQTFTREVILQSVEDGKLTVKAFRKSIVTFNDQGKPVETVVEKHGKLKDRSQLKPDQYLVIHEHAYKQFHASPPIVTEVQPETVIEVYSLGFLPEEVEAIKRALAAWNVGIVRFRFMGEGQGQVTIKRQRLTVAAYLVMSTVAGTLVSAEMLIDPSVTDFKALQSTVAHELGHMLGLPDSKERDSIMFYKSKGRNQTNGHIIPTEVDLAALRSKLLQ